MTAQEKKRILIFSTAYHPFIGGAEIAVREITQRLPEYSVTLVTARLRSDLPQTETIGNVSVKRIGKGSRWDKIRLLFFGRRYVERIGSFDCVWSVMASYAGFAALFYKKKYPDVPFLLTLQEGDSLAHVYRRVWFVWPWFRQIFTKADRIQAISAYLADWARRMGAVCPVDVVPNGVEIEKFQDITSKRQFIPKQAGETRDKKQLSLKSTFGIKENDRVVITISRLVKKNGVRDLVEAMKFLSEDVHLLILGDGELRQELEALSNNRVHFIGNVAHDELPRYLHSADVFCRPSISEGLGNAFLEAMAMGVPVIGTRVGGIPDFLIEGQTGWFCDVKNPKSIAEKVLYVLDERNKEQVEKVVEKAKKMVEEKYNWDLIAQDMRNIFQSVQSVKNQ